MSLALCIMHLEFEAFANFGFCVGSDDVQWFTRSS